MKTFGKVVLAFGLVAMTSAPVWAQGRGGFGGGFGGGGGAMLLSNKGVQEELKASDEQAKKLDALAEETRTKNRDQFEKLRDLPQDERREKMVELNRESQADLHASLTKILKPEQVKRYHQIQTQQAGVMAFSTPRVQEALKLTDDQKSKIREIAESNRGGGFAGLNKDSSADERAEARKKMAATRKENLAKVEAILTADQKAAWKDLVGSPYEVKFERRNP